MVFISAVKVQFLPSKLNFHVSIISLQLFQSEYVTGPTFLYNLLLGEKNHHRIQCAPHRNANKSFRALPVCRHYLVCILNVLLKSSPVHFIAFYFSSSPNCIHRITNLNELRLPRISHSLSLL